MAATTTGEKLVELSTLLTGSAMDHLLHIFPGTGNSPSISNLNIVGTSAIGAADGSIEITASAGTLPYEYSVGFGYQSGNTFTGLSAATYTVSVRDFSGFTDTIGGIPITEPAGTNNPIITELQIIDASSSVTTDGSITIIVTGGTSPYTYSLNGGAYQSSNEFIGLRADAYNISVKDDNGVISSLSGIKIGGQVPSKGAGGYGRGYERRKYLKIDVRSIELTDMKEIKKIKVDVPD